MFSSYVPELSYSRYQFGTQLLRPLWEIAFPLSLQPSSIQLTLPCSRHRAWLSWEEKAHPCSAKGKKQLHGGEKHWWKSDSPSPVSQAPHGWASLSLSHKFHLLSPPISTDSKAYVVFQAAAREKWIFRDRKTGSSPGPFCSCSNILCALFPALFETCCARCAQRWRIWFTASSLGHGASPVTTARSLASRYSEQPGAGAAGKFWRLSRYVYINIKVKIEGHP